MSQNANDQKQTGYPPPNNHRLGLPKALSLEKKKKKQAGRSGVTRRRKNTFIILARIAGQTFGSARLAALDLSSSPSRGEEKSARRATLDTRLRELIELHKFSVGGGGLKKRGQGAGGRHAAARRGIILHISHRPISCNACSPLVCCSRRSDSGSPRVAPVSASAGRSRSK